ncbi:hypothetical protein Tco_0912268, partial [Tanacetum coccineum]
FDPIAPNLYSPSDWVEISFLESSPSERSLSAEAPSSSTSDFNMFPSSAPFDSDAFWGVEYFTYHMLLSKDKAGVLDLTFLIEVLADLQQPGHIVSWY